MATKNSSEATQKRSRKIADGIGSNHRLINFDSIYD